MTCKQRIEIIRLIEKIEKKPLYARNIGLTYSIKKKGQ